MRTFNTFLTCFGLLLVSVLVLDSEAASRSAQVRYSTYHNARFDYSISYPVNILVPQGESVNADGQRFVSKDGRTEMLVYGSHNSLNQSLREVYEDESNRTAEHPNRVISYQILRQDWFVVSGVENGRVFYQKTMFRNSVFKTFRIEYDEQQKRTFDPITVAIARSFKN
jgi:hypothetical protein